MGNKRRAGDLQMEVKKEKRESRIERGRERWNVK